MFKKNDFFIFGFTTKDTKETTDEQTKSQPLKNSSSENDKHNKAGHDKNRNATLSLHVIFPPSTTPGYDQTGTL